MTKILTILATCLVAFLAMYTLSAQHQAAAETKIVAAEDSPTSITPHLGRNIAEGQNLLWCATLQLAWNELRELAGGTVGMEDADPLVELLNQADVTTETLGGDGYVAVAGTDAQALMGTMDSLQDDIAEMPREMASLPADALIAYASLSKALSFEWAFTRSGRPLVFADQKVAAFGIPQYRSDDPDIVKLGEQVVILDYASDDDFVLELTTDAAADRLILANVEPGTTLDDTVSAVLTRVAASQPTTLQDAETLSIPVLDVDVSRQYSELCNRALIVDNPDLNGAAFAGVMQRIAFRLDETGATLESHAAFVSTAPPRQLVFNKPFLILLMHAQAASPYLAVWVDNADVLVPFGE